MAEIRYMGTGTWARLITKDDGKFDKIVPVLPGEKLTVTDDEAKHFAGAHIPRHLRIFVMANGPEDPKGSHYETSRFDVQGNAVAYPELDMGSTVVGNRTITRTEDDNAEGFVIAGIDEGPASDNADAVLRNEAVAKGEEAYAKSLEEQKNKRRPSSSASSSGNTGSGSGEQK